MNYTSQTLNSLDMNLFEKTCPVLSEITNDLVFSGISLTKVLHMCIHIVTRKVTVHHFNIGAACFLAPKIPQCATDYMTI